MQTTLSHTQRGISLLIVLLIGSIMLLTSIAVASYALKSVKTAQTRTDSVQSLYSAEQAFECVKFWLNKNYVYFSDLSANGQTNDNPLPPSCNGVAITLGAGNLTYGKVGQVGTGTFNIGDTKVEVVRDLSAVGRFDGTIKVYSRTGSGGDRVAERYQEYSYRTIPGADFMFVIDRSGSITGTRPVGNTTPNPATGDWAKMTEAVVDGTTYLRTRVPAPFIGMLSFGTGMDASGVTDTGKRTDYYTAPSPCDYADAAIPSTAECFIDPDVGLTDDPADLPTDNGSPGDVTKYVMNLTDYTPTATNLSLALAVAATELMGKYYPAGGDETVITTNAGGDATKAVGVKSGWLEEYIAGGGTSAAGLKNRKFVAGGYTDPVTSLTYNLQGNDRDDAAFPDYIILITDGEPNAFVTFEPDDWYVNYVDATNNFVFDPVNGIGWVLSHFVAGESKVFRTVQWGSGMLVNTEDNSVTEYYWCNDAKGGSNKPSAQMNLTAETYNNKEYQLAMCNAFQVAEYVKAQGIGIAVLAINPSPKNADFLEHYISDVAYEEADFSTIYDALNNIIEKIVIKESR